MNQGNGKQTHINGKSLTSLSCPACGSLIAPEQYERILHIDEARQKKISEERAALECEREELEEQREKIADKAVATERAKWEADKARIALQIERLQKEAKVEQDRLERAHEKAMQAEQRRNEAQEKKLGQQIAVVKAKADADALARAKEAVRAAEAEQRAAIDDLKSQLKTSEQRRHREEDNFKKVVAELQRKAEGRDREHFGLDGEEDLVAVLRADFPGDLIEHHGKGGDVIHRVMDGGREAGVIVHEVKNRTTWSSDYVGQTQRAMETHNTQYGVLVSRVLPARRTGMCIMRGVIVVAPFIAAQVVSVVRDGIIAIHRLNVSEKDKTVKTAALFEYFRGQEFGTAINRVQMKVAELRDSLARERSNHDSWWRTRDQHYAAVLREVTGIDARVKDLLSGPSVAATRGTVVALHGATQ